MPLGGYDVTVLDAASSANAAKWLAERGYEVPEGAAEALSAATKGGAVIAVARIDGAQLAFEEGVARLPPLSFVVEGPPALPLRLAGLGAAGARDVVLDVLSPGARIEATNLLNVAVPTNLDVREEAMSDLDGLYRAIVDHALEKTPGAAMTEYAWLASTCDGCAEGTGLGVDELLALGVDRLPSGADGSQRELIVDVSESLSRAPEGPPALKPAMAACYGKALGEMRGLAGEAKVSIETGAGGKVKSAKIQDASAEALGRCVEEAARSVKLDKADASGTITARFALLSRAYLASMVLTRLRVRASSGPLRRRRPPPRRAHRGRPRGRTDRRGREEGVLRDAHEQLPRALRRAAPLAGRARVRGAEARRVGTEAEEPAAALAAAGCFGERAGLREAHVVTGRLHVGVREAGRPQRRRAQARRAAPGRRAAGSLGVRDRLPRRRAPEAGAHGRDGERRPDGLLRHIHVVWLRRNPGGRRVWMPRGDGHGAAADVAGYHCYRGPAPARSAGEIVDGLALRATTRPPRVRGTFFGATCNGRNSAPSNARGVCVRFESTRFAVVSSPGSHASPRRGTPRSRRTPLILVWPLPTGFKR